MRRNKPGYKGPNVKPDKWASDADVAKAVRNYFEDTIGIVCPVSFIPMWEKSGPVRDIFAENQNILGTDSKTLKWGRDRLYFNGSGSYLYFSNDGRYTPSPGFTIFTRATIYSFTNYDKLFDTKSNYLGTSGWTVSLRDTNTFDFSCGGGNSFLTFFNNAFVLGKEYSFSWGYIPDVKYCRLDINGKFFDAQTLASWSAVNNTVNFNIGAYNGGSGYEPEIAIDYFALFPALVTPDTGIDGKIAKLFHYEPYAAIQPRSFPKYFDIGLSYIIGSTTWGHITNVVETNTRTFLGNWTGNGQIANTGDDEIMTLDTGDSMISEIVNTGAGKVITLLQNKY